MARPRVSRSNAMITIRLDQSVKDRLLAVAHHLQTATNAVDPSDVNLSEFLRDSIMELLLSYEDDCGGREKLARDYEDAVFRSLARAYEEAEARKSGAGGR